MPFPVIATHSLTEISLASYTVLEGTGVIGVSALLVLSPDSQRSAWCPAILDKPLSVKWMSSDYSQDRGVLKGQGQHDGPWQSLG